MTNLVHESIPAVDDSEIESYQIEQKNGVTELGLALTGVVTEASDDGATIFEAWLVNVAVYPVEGPWVRLFLYDESEILVDTVELHGEEAVLQPGEAEIVRGIYRPSARSAEIVQETVYIRDKRTFSFTLHMADKPRSNPSVLKSVADTLSFVEYEALWTQPGTTWESFEVQFHYDRVIKR